MMNGVIERSKRQRILRRVLENTEIYTKQELSKMSAQELIQMQDILLIKLIIKVKFNTRNNTMSQHWN